MILSLGLHPNTLDYNRYPDLDEETLTARIDAAVAGLRESGFDIVSCQLSDDPDVAEKQVRECVAGQPVETVMIGAGLRMAPEHTLLFERLVNLVNQLVPGVVFCFNTSPETTIDALRRVTRDR
jgi:hypothetical protein